MRRMPRAHLRPEKGLRSARTQTKLDAEGAMSFVATEVYLQDKDANGGPKVGADQTQCLLLRLGMLLAMVERIKAGDYV